MTKLVCLFLIFSFCMTLHIDMRVIFDSFRTKIFKIIDIPILYFLWDFQRVNLSSKGFECRAFVAYAEDSSASVCYAFHV